jgi:flagellar biosynthesis/type III secretory pathway M-ring protein FliF/YscJ
MFRATRPLRQVSSRMPSRLQRQRPFVMFIVPIVIVGIGAFFAITLGQVVRRRMLENRAEKEEAKEKDKEKEAAPAEVPEEKKPGGKQ